MECRLSVSHVIFKNVDQMKEIIRVKEIIKTPIHFPKYVVLNSKLNFLLRCLIAIHIQKI